MNLSGLAMTLPDAGADVGAALDQPIGDRALQVLMPLSPTPTYSSPYFGSAWEMEQEDREDQRERFRRNIAVGQTPLHLAAVFGHHEVTALLLDAGADPNHQDAVRNAPLHLAADWHVAVALLDAGANPNLPNAAGRTPGDMATHPVIMALLGETWPSELLVEIMRKIDNGQCREYFMADFRGFQRRLRNSTRRFVGREVPLEDAYSTSGATISMPPIST